MGLENFHLIVGELMMYCQRIEHDVKLIYAGMLAGDFNENIDKIKRKNLGTVLKWLEDLDNSDGQPYFQEGDYDLLDDIRNIRNHWAHEAYGKFIYFSGNQYVTAFNKEFNRLLNDHNRLQKLSNQVEEVRFDVMRKYGRA